VNTPLVKALLWSLLVLTWIFIVAIIVSTINRLT
jgi:hypothetical protein